MKNLVDLFPHKDMTLERALQLQNYLGMYFEVNDGIVSKIWCEEVKK